jgi:catalase
MIVPDGPDAADELSGRGHALEFLKDQYRHCKPMLLVGAARTLLDAAGIPPRLPSGEADVGLLQFDGQEMGAAVPAFVDALTHHRNFARETDPPRV